MGKPRYNRKQPQKKQAKRKKKSKTAPAARKTFTHKVYGDIPLIEKKIVGTDGIERSYYDFDPDFSPKLPKSAVRGNISQQVFCSMCHVPKYFYLDEKRTCIQCGESFVFRAKEQKYWFEHLKFNFHAEAVRCVACRRQKRSVQAVRNQLTAASEKIIQKEDDPLALLAYSEAVAAHYEMFNKGNLNKAISCARKANKLSPRLYESLFWEAECQRLSRRRKKATELFKQFICEASKVKRCRALVSRAKRIVE